jgi:hypothetical protein
MLTKELFLGPHLPSNSFVMNIFQRNPIEINGLAEMIGVDVLGKKPVSLKRGVGGGGIKQ